MEIECCSIKSSFRFSHKHILKKSNEIHNKLNVFKLIFTFNSIKNFIQNKVNYNGRLIHNVFSFHFK